MVSPLISDTTSHSNLAEKARLLRSTPLFSPRSGYDPFSEKKLLFLALAGEKPVSAAGSSHWIKTDSGGHAAPDNPAEIARLLQRLDVSYDLVQKDTATLAYVALEPASLSGFLATQNDQREAGKWFGYPPTAVEAFAAGQSMSPNEQQAVEAAFRAPVFSTFRLSRAHAAEELAVMRRWWLVLERYGFEA